MKLSLKEINQQVVKQRKQQLLTDRWIPVPSNPNQMYIIHFDIVLVHVSITLHIERHNETYRIGCAPSPSQSRESKKPKKHQAERAVRKKKSATIDLRDKNTKLSLSKLKARRGTSTGAASASTSNACSSKLVSPNFQPRNRRTRYPQ